MTVVDGRQSAGRYQVTSSIAGHGGPSRSAARNADPDSLPLGCRSPRLQRCVAMIASTTPRHSSTRSLVDVRIALTDVARHPAEVVLDRTMGGVLEVHEERPVLRVEQVPRMGLAVQELLGVLAGRPIDRLRLAERVAEQRPGPSPARSGVTTRPRHVSLNLRHPLREVRGGDVDRPQPAVKTLECLGVDRGRKWPSLSLDSNEVHREIWKPSRTWTRGLTRPSRAGQPGWPSAPAG